MMNGCLRWVAAALMSLGLLGQNPAPGPSGNPALGMRMYREGQLPSGQPIEALVKGDTPIPGTSFSCMGCHLRSGFGGVEGGIRTQPVSGPRLYTTAYKDFPNHTAAQRAQLPVRWQTPPRRPAYDDETLARVIREGVDNTGRVINDVMPRYRLSDGDMAHLIAYLKTLSSVVPPGVSDTTLRFATIVTEGVPAADRELMLKSLENQFTRHNNLGQTFTTRGYTTTSMLEGTRSYRAWALSLWELKGSPSTWEEQLEAYLQADPVFALVGGLARDDWRPIHDFCERHELPCLLPMTDLPVRADAAWYTVYFSQGLYQEGEAAATHLASNPALDHGRRVIQVVGDGPASAALADGFRAGWESAQGGAVHDFRLPAGRELDAVTLRRLIAKDRPGALAIWAGPEALQALRGLASRSQTLPLIYTSSTSLGPAFRTLPDSLRKSTFLTYPFRLTPDPSAPKSDPTDPRHISSRVYTLVQILSQLNATMDQNFFRDNLLDVLNDLGDLIHTDYERLSFGPGQRYASKGCYLVQLSPGASPDLVKRSEWIVR